MNDTASLYAGGNVPVEKDKVMTEKKWDLGSEAREDQRAYEAKLTWRV